MGVSGKEGRIQEGCTTVDAHIVQRCIWHRKEVDIVQFERLAGEPITRRANALSPDRTRIEGICGGDVDVRVNPKGLERIG